MLDYLMRGFNYSVFDLVDLYSTARSIEPITCEFKCSSLYNPMKVSATATGSTRVILCLITPEPINENAIPSRMRIARYHPSNLTVQFQLSTQDLASVDPRFQELFTLGA